MTLSKPSSRTDTYMISLLQFPPRNVKCPRKATRRVLWRYSTFSSRWNVSISDVTIGTQPDVLIRYYITRFTYARELQAKRKGQHVLYGHFNIGPVWINLSARTTILWPWMSRRSQTIIATWSIQTAILRCYPCDNQVVLACYDSIVFIF